MGIYRWEKAEEKDFTGRKAKGSSEKPSRRDYQLLSITTSAPSLPPYDKLTPILKRKAPRFRILKKCMTRLEALKLIRNGPTHPAMMRMREESEHKMEFPSWMRLTSGKNLFQDFLPYVELSLYYITLFWNAREFSGRLGHVPWREVSSHLIALIVGISKKRCSLSSTSKSLSSWTLMRDGNG